MAEQEPQLCQCGHAPDFCHVKNAEKWCGANVEWMAELVRGLVQELQERRACLVEARADLARIMGAGVEDGGLWIRAVAEARLPMLDGAIAETDKALIAAGVSGAD